MLHGLSQLQPGFLPSANHLHLQPFTPFYVISVLRVIEQGNWYGLGAISLRNGEQWDSIYLWGSRQCNAGCVQSGAEGGGDGGLSTN